MKKALRLTDVYFGLGINRTIIPQQYDTNPTHSSSIIISGWVCYLKQVASPPMYLPTIQLLHKLFIDGNADKSRRTSADRASRTLKEQVSARDWYE